MPDSHIELAGQRPVRGTARGGHLLDAVMRPTLELIVEDAPSHLRNCHDPETGLALIAPEL